MNRSREIDDRSEFFQLLLQLEQVGSADSFSDAERKQLESAIDNLEDDDRDEIQRAQKYLNLLQVAREAVREESRQVSQDPTKKDGTRETFTAKTPAAIGRFEIIRRLGEGGFATVFLARDPDLDRMVAIKILKPAAIMSADSQMRFEREAHAAALLSHPAIVPIFEYGRSDAVSFIAFEYCSGETLAEWLEENDGQVDEQTAASIVARLSEAVQHAHSRNVIHRDLKPANVLIAQNENNNFLADSIRISDFGLAKFERKPGDPELTQTGAIMGTPSYMSPEQARGESQIGPATDIYALGAILYELLTGTLPHRKENHLATFRAIEIDQPVAPRKTNFSVPRDLEAICLKCLEKNPQKRYASASDLEQDLRRWQSGLPVRARHITGSERFLRWCRRNPVVAALVTTTAFALLIGFIVSAWQWSESQSNLKESEVQRKKADGRLLKLENSIEFIMSEYSNSLGEQTSLRPDQRRILIELLDVHKALVQEDGDEISANIVTIRAYHRIARIAHMLGEHEQVSSTANQTLELIERVEPGQPHFNEAQLIRNEIQVFLSQAFADQGDLAAAAQLMVAEIENLGTRRHLMEEERYHRFAIELYRHLGIFLVRQQDYDQAFDAHVGQLENLNALTENENLEYRVLQATATRDLARVTLAQGDRKQAKSYYKQAVDLYEQLVELHPDDNRLHQHYGGSLRDLGGLLLGSGQLENARKTLQKSIEQYEIVGSDPEINRGIRMGYIASMYSLSRAQSALNDLPAAEATLRQCLAELAPMPEIAYRFINQAVVHLDLAKLTQELGDFDAADHHLRQAAEVCSDGITKFPQNLRFIPILVDVHRQSGKLLLAQDQVADAGDQWLSASQYAAQVFVRYGDNRRIRNAALNQMKRHADFIVEQDLLEDAIPLALGIAEVAAEDGDEQFLAASFLAGITLRLEESAEEGELLNTRQLISRQAVELLGDAVAMGFNDRELLNRDPWKSFSRRPAFQRVLQHLK